MPFKLVKLSKIRLRHIVLSIVLLLLPSTGFDLYAHITSSTYLDNFIFQPPRNIFGIDIPRYVLLQPMFLLGALGGVLPGAFTAFIFIYTSIFFGEKVWLDKSLPFRLKTVPLAIILYNTIYFSASGVSINFLLLSIFVWQFRVKFLLLATFSSPLGFFVGLPLVVARIMLVKQRRINLLTLMLTLLAFTVFYGILSANYGIQTHSSLSEPVTLLNIFDVMGRKSFELLMLLLSVLIVGISSSIPLKIRSFKENQLLLIFYVLIFPLLLIYPASREYGKNANPSINPTSYLLSRVLASNDASNLPSSVHATNESLICMAFFSPLGCDMLIRQNLKNIYNNRLYYINPN